MTQTKQCPSCKTDIHSDATKCPNCKSDFRNWFIRHPVLSVLLFVFIGIPFLVTIIGIGRVASKDTTGTSEVTLAPEVKAKYEQELSVLKKNFNYTEDEFNKTGWYVHKDQTSYNRKMLRLHVSKTGSRYLESQYYGSTWAFHTHARVLIADKVYTTDTVPNRNNSNQREVDDNAGIHENIDYIIASDNGIIEAIANSGTQEVKVRLEGDQKYDEFILSANDKKAITEGYRLSQLLKALN